MHNTFIVLHDIKTGREVALRTLLIQRIFDKTEGHRTCCGVEITNKHLLYVSESLDEILRAIGSAERDS